MRERDLKNLRAIFNGLKFANRNANLFGGFAIADGDSIVLQSIEVDYDAFWGADFVLLAVAFADVARIIPSDITVSGAKLVVNGAGFRNELGFVLE